MLGTRRLGPEPSEQSLTALNSDMDLTTYGCAFPVSDLTETIDEATLSAPHRAYGVLE